MTLLHMYVHMLICIAIPLWSVHFHIFCCDTVTVVVLRSVVPCACLTHLLTPVMCCLSCVKRFRVEHTEAMTLRFHVAMVL